jgi:hypothetical protein
MVQQAVAGVRYRILFAEAIENLDKNARQTLTGRWSAQIYDYTNNQTLEAAADFPQATNASVTPSAAQPLPSAAEWEEAVEIVRRDEQFRVQLNCNLLIPYRPMPCAGARSRTGRRHPRTFTVGLLRHRAPGSANRLLRSTW